MLKIELSAMTILENIYSWNEEFSKNDNQKYSNRHEQAVLMMENFSIF